MEHSEISTIANEVFASYPGIAEEIEFSRSITPSDFRHQLTERFTSMLKETA